MYRDALQKTFRPDGREPKQGLDTLRLKNVALDLTASVKQKHNVTSSIFQVKQRGI